MLEKYALVSTTLKVFFQRLKMENIHVLITTGCANIERVFLCAFRTFARNVVSFNSPIA